MKKTSLFCLLISAMTFTLFAHASVDSEYPFLVLTRNKSDRPEIRTENLKLLTPDAFETHGFKIVLGKDNDAVSTHAEEALKLRAASVLFHLETAKGYFLNRVRSTDVQNLEKIIVRLEFTGSFDEDGHFKNENTPPIYNDALSVPSGSDFESGVPWSREIWFRPKKEIPLKEIMPTDSSGGLVKQANAVLLPGQADIALQNAIYYSISDGGLGKTYMKTAARQVGAVALIEAGLLFTQLINHISMPKSYFLDTAMVPEFVYHEFSHIALSDQIDITHSTAINEGVADYFAADLLGSPQLGKKITKYSPWTMKNGKKSKPFSIHYESNDAATEDYVLSFLWGIRGFLGEEKTNELIFEARHSLSTQSSDIRFGLTEALLSACDRVCTSPAANKSMLLRYFAIAGQP